MAGKAKKATKRTTKKKVVKKTTKKKTTKKKTVKKATKKKVAKKTAKKTTKKAPAKKVAKKTTKKKVVKKAVKKPTKKVAKKKTAKKTVKKTPVKKAVTKAVKKPVEKPPQKNPLTRADLNRYKKLLLSLREKISHQVAFLAKSGLKPMPITDNNTDSFNREQDLSMAGNEQDILNEINAALVRIKNKTFGMCEETGAPINRERLQAIPYARLSVKAQSKTEHSRRALVMSML